MLHAEPGFLACCALNSAAARRRVDRDGRELADVAAARKEALRYAGELLQNGGGEHLWTGHEWRMLVCDDSGDEVLALRFSASG